MDTSFEELPKDLSPFPGLAIHLLKGGLVGFWIEAVFGGTADIWTLQFRSIWENGTSLRPGFAEC